MSDKLISIENLSFGYGKKLLHKDINMQFNRGKVSAIMGGSGCGKTTILRLIGGQLTPNSGKVVVDGDIVHEQDRDSEQVATCDRRDRQSVKVFYQRHLGRNTTFRRGLLRWLDSTIYRTTSRWR